MTLELILEHFKNI